MLSVLNNTHVSLAAYSNFCCLLCCLNRKLSWCIMAVITWLLIIISGSVLSFHFQWRWLYVMALYFMLDCAALYHSVWNLKSEFMNYKATWIHSYNNGVWSCLIFLKQRGAVVVCMLKNFSDFNLFSHSPLWCSSLWTGCLFPVWNCMCL